MTNLLGSDSWSRYVPYDGGGTASPAYFDTWISLQANHKYYFKAYRGRWGGSGSGNNQITVTYDSFWSKTILLSDNNGGISEDYITFFNAGSSGGSARIGTYLGGVCDVGASSGNYANIYMVVDVTPLEELTGTTYTTDTFWTKIGSAVFYNSKTIEV